MTRFVDLTYCTLAVCTVIVAFARQLVNPDVEITSSAAACATNCAMNAVMASPLAYLNSHHITGVARKTFFRYVCFSALDELSKVERSKKSYESEKSSAFRRIGRSGIRRSQSKQRQPIKFVHQEFVKYSKWVREAFRRKYMQGKQPLGHTGST